MNLEQLRELMDTDARKRLKAQEQTIKDLHKRIADDKRELEAYRALGTVEELRDRVTLPYPDDDGLAPLPYPDPAQQSVEAYEDAWDYPTPEQQKRFSGLLEDDA